jgi:hypothetical protein
VALIPTDLIKWLMSVSDLTRIKIKSVEETSEFIILGLDSKGEVKIKIKKINLSRLLIDLVKIQTGSVASNHNKSIIEDLIKRFD